MRNPVGVGSTPGWIATWGFWLGRVSGLYGFWGFGLALTPRVGALGGLMDGETSLMGLGSNMAVGIWLRVSSSECRKMLSASVETNGVSGFVDRGGEDSMVVGGFEIVEVGALGGFEGVLEGDLDRDLLEGDLDRDLLGGDLDRDLLNLASEWQLLSRRLCGLFSRLE